MTYASMTGTGDVARGVALVGSGNMDITGRVFVAHDSCITGSGANNCGGNNYKASCGKLVQQTVTINTPTPTAPTPTPTAPTSSSSYLAANLWFVVGLAISMFL
jgi:hypothetical protein